MVLRCRPRLLKGGTPKYRSPELTIRLCLWHVYRLGMVAGYHYYRLDFPVYWFEKPYTHLRTSNPPNTDLLGCSRGRCRSMSLSMTPNRWTYTSQSPAWGGRVSRAGWVRGLSSINFGPPDPTRPGAARCTFFTPKVPHVSIFKCLLFLNVVLASSTPSLTFL